MDEENDSDVKEIESCLDKNMSEDGSVGTVIVKDVEDVVSNEVVPKAKPQGVRRNSTGAIGIRGGKPQVQSRYRGNVHVSSIHDLCKHGGKRCDQDVPVAVKPWKVVRKKSVEGSEESSGLRRKVSGSVSGESLVTKPQSSVAAKRDVLAVRKKPSASANSESSRSRADSETVRSVDGLSVRSNDKARKKKVTENTLSGSAVAKKAPGLRTEKVSRISNAESSKASALKNREKEKEKVTSCEDVKEKTVCVVESSINGDQSVKRPSSSKSSSRDPLPTKQVLGSINTGLNKKKESGSVELEASPKTAKKIRPKRIGAKVDIAKQLSFKKGKTIEPKSEGSSPRWIKFRRRAVQEPKTQTEGKKKKLKETGVDPEAKSESCEGSKGEKVVLRHQKVEGKKKMMTLFNNVIEETVNKLTKVRKNKVKALIGAFETVISLQDTKTSQKVHRKTATASASQVSPLNSQQ